MNKRDNKEFDDMGLVPELFDGKHQVIPIISGGDDTIEEVNIPESLPILTLRSSVIFPGSVTPITVGRPKSIALVRAVESGDGLLGAVLQIDSAVEKP
ncbi:MAG: LON peptidase substrate-binding domain-containing protein, partial [Alistipes sp.]|nr:LON peptidase substrate-binding domain-containing protein [Alistipes sp.]